MPRPKRCEGLAIPLTAQLPRLMPKRVMQKVVWHHLMRANVLKRFRPLQPRELVADAATNTIYISGVGKESAIG